MVFSRMAFPFFQSYTATGVLFASSAKGVRYGHVV